MRAWHLVGLPSPEEGTRLLYEPPHPGTPLVLAPPIPSSDQEQIIAAYREMLAEVPPPRVEVDWRRAGIEAQQRSFLEWKRSRLGASAVLLVVKVRVPGVPATAVAEDPLVRSWEHTVVATGDAMPDAPLANLAHFTKHVRDALRRLYEELAVQRGVAPWANLEPILYCLINPVDVVETVNGFVDLQLEEKIAEQPVGALTRQAVARLLAARTEDERVV